MGPIHIMVLITLSFAGQPDQHVRGVIAQPSFTEMAKCDAERNSADFADFLEHSMANLKQQADADSVSTQSVCVDLSNVDKG